MNQWQDRPREIRNLLNPAFCSLLLLRSMQGFEEKGKGHMPLSLLLLVLPLCLHQESRDIFINNNRSYLLKIIENHPQLLIGFAHRTQSLLPYSFEALGLSMDVGGYTINEDGYFVFNSKSITKNNTK